MTSSQAGVCYFFDKLPRELRDKIYEQAYMYSSRKCSEKVFDAHEITIPFGCAATSKAARTVPNRFCRGLLVSKQYLEEALPHIIRGAKFSLPDEEDLEILTSRFTMIQHEITSLHQDYNHMNSDGSSLAAFVEAVNECPRLIDLTLCIDREFIVNWKDGSQWPKHRLDYERVMLDVCALKNLRGLRSFGLQVDDSYTEYGKAGETLGQEIREVVTKGRK
ncbi:hypothetical protein LTR37_015021 [Vermiconidia calcicola]|uniref:Uncharacterized protein n=1 Tax=Vermiconidia calcicola TaxID=1690605 RepID=A0ACC3MSW1_9PEZI|nr:hypothetical protein LTR37_015021 [Vermiconidia calcicola]